MLSPWLWRAAAWAVLGLGLVALTLGVALPRLAGAQPYTVLSGSMRPGLPPGTLAVVRPVEATEVGVGDVITYQLRPGDPAVVTHRVVAVSADAGGDTAFRTRGDANESADPAWVLPEQVRGRLWYAVPWLGRVGAVLDRGHRELLGRVLGAGLLGYAALTAAAAWRERSVACRPGRKHALV